ncbi:hypothetical protein FBU30_005348 [Linnemannia zychae]|nr:hypothetical protein FBU30_005348 [Linnemannia zychae]
MRFFGESRHGSHLSSMMPSHSSLPKRTTRSWTWSLLCSVVILNSFLGLLSPSTTGGTALAAPNSGFCGDCQTFANAIGVCGGSFTPADIEVPTEYVLQQAYAKCICTSVMQKVLWTCAKCEFLAGRGSQGVPPKKHQMTCMGWGITIDQYNAPYTGVVAPGTTTDLGNGNPNPPPAPTTAAPPTNPTTSNGGTKPSGGGSTPSGGNGDNKPSGTATDSNSPSSSQDSLNGDSSTTGASNGPNTTAIGISVGIIGVALIAGVMAVVMMKRRRRRRSPLDLDTSPALNHFVGLEDKWENKPNHRPQSPPLPNIPVASAAPMVGAGSRGGNGRYGGDGSVVGGYEPQYDGQYDYDGYGHHGGYDAYGQSGHGHGHGGYGYDNQQSYDHYGGQYDQGGYQDAYQMHTYGYDQQPSKHYGESSNDAKRPL